MLRPFALLLAVLSGCATYTPPRLSEVTPETRIRVTYQDTCCSRVVAGQVVGYDADSLRLRVMASTGAALALPWPSIKSVESAHRELKAGTGAAAGLFVGALAGAISGYATSCSHCDGDWRGAGAAFGAVGGGLAGTLLGAIIGVSIEHDVWDPVTGLPAPRTAGRLNLRLTITR